MYWDWTGNRYHYRKSLILKIKEPFSAISHALGAVFAVIALVILIQESVNPIKPWHIVSFSIFGILLKLFWKSLPNWFSITFYIFMGWLSIIAIYPMIMTLQIGAMVWIFIGGFFYTVGAIILELDNPKLFPKIFSAHEL